MPQSVKYYLVAAEALPDVLRKVSEATRLLETHEARTAGEAARAAGVSRSAFYKYKDAVRPFYNMRAEHIVTFQAILKDKTGVLSRMLSVFARSGANILTINQNIPVNGCAAVTVSAEISGLRTPLEEAITEISELEGVIKFEILSG